jgi:3',5'-cyclic AMP phosphodiesterase CpdA
MSKVSSAIVLSDIHLGRKTGYLSTEDANYASNKAVVLHALQELGPQDEVIINGDLLEISLASFEIIYRELAEFLSVLAQAGPYKRIVFVPGNHDHHYWRFLAEQAIERKASSSQYSDVSNENYPYCFVDERFSSAAEGLPCRLIFSDLWPKETKAPEFVVKYPHHLVEIVNAEGNPRYFFTHGHFLESRFRPMNALLKPNHLEELEAFNNIWLEFFDYNLGHAGRLSNAVLSVVEKYEQANQDAKKLIKQGMSYLYPQLKAKLGCTKAWLLKAAMKLGLRLFPAVPQNDVRGNPLDAKLEKNIIAYLNDYVIGRYTKAKALDLHLPCDTDIPVPFHFVFAHTHKPVTGKGDDMRSVIVDEQTYPVLNTGGWVRKDEDGTYKGENAGILQINQNGYFWMSMADRLA